mgnify:CR=1 FL=1
MDERGQEGPCDDRERENGLFNGAERKFPKPAGLFEIGQLDGAHRRPGKPGQARG